MRRLVQSVAHVHPGRGTILSRTVPPMVGSLPAMTDHALPSRPRLHRARTACLWLALLAAWSLAFAYLLEYGFGYHPCALCTLERYGFLALFLAGAILAYPALRLVRKARSRTRATAESRSRQAGSASTWEELRSANDANPNVGRKDRKLGSRLGIIMAATATAGCAVLVTTVWL